MITKKCCRCQVEKELSDFNFKVKSKLIYQSECRECHKTYCKNDYEAKKSIYVARAAKHTIIRKNRNWNFLKEYLQDKNCVDCGLSDLTVLEFDHIEHNKSYDVSRLMGLAVWARVLDEIHKCEIVCANCHRKRTASRGGFRRSFW